MMGLKLNHVSKKGYWCLQVSYGTPVKYELDIQLVTHNLIIRKIMENNGHRKLL